MRAALLSLLLLAACEKTSEKYCGLHPEDTEHCSTDAGRACDVDEDCTAPGLNVCTASGSCAQCDMADASACTGTTPVCDTGSNACRKCALDAECASGVCSDDGSCAEETSVAYVAAAGTGTTCTKSMPCADLDVAQKTMKAHIRVDGTIMQTQTAVFTAGTRTIHGVGATVQVPGAMSAISLSNAGTNLTIRGLTFTATAGADLGQPMIDVPMSGPRLELERVTIAHGQNTAVRSQRNSIIIIHRSTIAFNAEGPALDLSNGQYEVTNSVIVQNGANDNANGGVLLTPLQAGSMHTFAFNTVADNNSSRTGGRSTGIACTAAVISNSIVTGNMLTNCDGDYLLWNTGDNSPTHTPEGTALIDDEPGFANTTDITSPMFYRLSTTSMAIDAADPAATNTIDIDGDARPANGRSDIGADERL